MFGSRFFHGMLAGVIVGGAITAIVNPLDKRSCRNLKRRAGRMARDISCAMHSAGDFMK